MASRRRFQRLITAAQQIIAKLQTIQKFKHVRIAIIGGLAVWRYLPSYRETEDVDYLLCVEKNFKKREEEEEEEEEENPFHERFFELPSGMSELFKCNLSQNHSKELKLEYGPVFCLARRANSDPLGPEDEDPFKTKNKARYEYIPVDFISSELCPFIPEAAVPISEVNLNDLPYISLLDLLVFKINSCGMRLSDEKKHRDAEDAVELVKLLEAEGPIILSQQQRDIVEKGADSVAELLDGEHQKTWWKTKLNLQ